jgi:CheY-like chemotaxis protein
MIAVETGCRLLLVDDNNDLAELLGDALRALGHSVQLAFDPPGALEIATTYVPDAALLDLGLPVRDGCEVALRLRSRDGWKQVRLIALTGYGLENDRERTKQAGFDGHLVKPIDVLELDRLLREGVSGPPVVRLPQPERE